MEKYKRFPQTLKISAGHKYFDMSDFRRWLWLLVSAVKNRQTYFAAITRVSQHRFQDSIQITKKAA